MPTPPGSRAGQGAAPCPAASLRTAPRRQEPNAARAHRPSPGCYPAPVASQAPRIRAAVEADAPAIRALIRQAQLNPRDLDWRRFLVADEDGEVVACAQVRVHHGGTPELASVAVAQTQRGRGIGRAIAEAAIAREPVRPLYLYTESRTEAFWTEARVPHDRGRRDPARPAGLAAHRPRRDGGVLGRHARAIPDRRDAPRRILTRAARAAD